MSSTGTDNDATVKAASAPSGLPVDATPAPSDTTPVAATLPHDNTKKDIVFVATKVRPPALHIQHVGIGTLFLHRAEAIAGITAVKAVIHASKNHKTRAELDMLEDRQQKNGLSPEDASQVVPLAVKLNDHARLKDVHAVLEVFEQNVPADSKGKSEAEQRQQLETRENAARATLGLPPETADSAPKSAEPAAAAPSGAPADFPIHQHNNGELAMEEAKHFARSFTINASNDAFQNFARNNGKLVKRQAEMDKQAQGMTPEQKQEAENNWFNGVAEHWKTTDKWDRELFMQKAGARDGRQPDLDGLRDRVEQTEAMAALVKSLKNGEKPEQTTAHVYIDPTTAFTPIVPGMPSNSREK